MRLNKPLGERSFIQARVLVEREQDAQGLNERLGLDEEKKGKMFHFVEGPEPDEVVTSLRRVEATVNLLILFPEERVRIMKILDSSKTWLKQFSTRQFSIDQGWNQEAAYYLQQLFPQDLELQNMLLHGLKEKITFVFDRTFRELDLSALLQALEAAVMLQALYPAEYKYFEQKIHDLIGQMDVAFFDQLNLQAFSKIAFAVLRIDPKIHAQLHVYTETHLDSFLSFERQSERMQSKSSPNIPSRPIGRYAAYKLLLAESIEVSPNGFLAAKEKQTMDKRPPLPERPVQ